MGSTILDGSSTILDGGSTILDGSSTIFCRFSPFFVDFHHFLLIFTIYALLSRFTFCRDLRTFSANFFWPKQPAPLHHSLFSCMEKMLRLRKESPQNKIFLSHLKVLN